MASVLPATITEKREQMDKRYDVIVIGAGHAGCEAAVASARLGARTLLVTSDITKIAQMSCNPSIGGVGKGQIVRELDALGGYTAKIADATTIQYRMLNRSKGPAMHSPRAQCDRELYTLEWRRVIENTENLELWQETIEELVIENGECKGIASRYEGVIKSQSVILTAGTFLRGKIHIGMQSWEGGRIDEIAVPRLSEQLEAHGIPRIRFKTGTSARIDIRSIDLEKLEAAGIDLKEHQYNKIRQGYMYILDDGGETRVRSYNYGTDSARYELTKKSGGLTARKEDIMELTKEEFDAFWEQTAGRRIEKTRYYIELEEGRVAELDIYETGRLEGRATVEVEFLEQRLADAETKARDFAKNKKPEWIGEEVTEDPTYKNQALAS